MAVFELLESQKLISRKIWVIEKSKHFHTVPYLLIPFSAQCSSLSSIFLRWQPSKATKGHLRVRLVDLTNHVSINSHETTLLPVAVRAERGRHVPREVQSFTQQLSNSQRKWPWTTVSKASKGHCLRNKTNDNDSINHVRFLESLERERSAS